ncbi:MAG: DUF370 domain-containing protein [Armatimonadota bacterium]
MKRSPVLPVGFQNFVMTEQVVAVVSSDSAPMRRLVQSLRNSERLVDATQGRRTRCLIFLSSGHIVLSALSQEALLRRLSGGVEKLEDMDKVGGDGE